MLDVLFAMVHDVVHHHFESSPESPRKEHVNVFKTSQNFVSLLVPGAIRTHLQAIRLLLPVPLDNTEEEAEWLVGECDKNLWRKLSEMILSKEEHEEKKCYGQGTDVKKEKSMIQEKSTIRSRGGRFVVAMTNISGSFFQQRLPPFVSSNGRRGQAPCSTNTKNTNLDAEYFKEMENVFLLRHVSLSLGNNTHRIVSSANTPQCDIARLIQAHTEILLEPKRDREDDDEEAPTNAVRDGIVPEKKKRLEQQKKNNRVTKCKTKDTKKKSEKQTVEDVGRSPHPKEDNNLSAEDIVTLTELVASWYEAVVDARLKKLQGNIRSVGGTSPSTVPHPSPLLVPRIVRLSQRLHLSIKEHLALCYLVALHTGPWLTVFVGGFPASPVTLSRYVGFHPDELCAFILESRAHMKQGIITASDPRLSSKAILDTRLLLQQEVLSVLCGVELSDEEAIKIENTALEAVLQEEEVVDQATLTPREDERSRNHQKREDGLESAQDEEEESSASDSVEGVVDEGGLVCHSEIQPSATKKCETAATMVTPADVGVRATTGVHHRARKDALPYRNDIEYLDDAFKALAAAIKIRNNEGEIKDDEEGYFNMPKSKVEASLREQRGKQRVALVRWESRLLATKAINTAAPIDDGQSMAPSWLPRVELVCERLKLSPFERKILLLQVGNVVSHDILIAINGRYVMREGQRELTVGYILFVLCEHLSERVQYRQCFLPSAPLVVNALISVSITSSTTRSCFNTDLMDYTVDMDRKMVDFLMGVESSSEDMVPGSNLYTPTVPISNVILPEETKLLVKRTVDHYSLFSMVKKRCGFADGLGQSSSGLVFLFHGPSGTGKTMLANAIAHDAKKKILSVNLFLLHRGGDVGNNKQNDVLRFIFREAKLSNAIVFFDECDSFFESRETNPLITSVLTEFEKYDGMIIMATNRAQGLDEAMNRRISLMVEFKLPDYNLREKIWEAHLPRDKLSLDPKTLQSLRPIAMEYELSGGLIRNAALAAISNAVARQHSENPTITMSDLVHGAKLQLRGFLSSTFTTGSASGSSGAAGGNHNSPMFGDVFITPKRSLQELIVDPSTKEQLTMIPRIAKSRQTLFSQWGFSDSTPGGDVLGQQLYLIYGPKGTGKSMAVEGIGFECGCGIRVVNVSEILLTSSLSVGPLFEEARKLNALLVFDEAQGLFDFSERSLQAVQLIQYHAAKYPRPVILIASTTTSPFSSFGSVGAHSLDTRSLNVSFAAEIRMSFPSKALRQELWRRSVPEPVPCTMSLADWEVLSVEVLSAKGIQTICFHACCRLALRLSRHVSTTTVIEEDVCTLTLQSLMAEKELLMSRERERGLHSNMFA